MRADRRDSYDEKIQVNIIKNTCKKIAKEFQLNLDLGEFDSISTGYGKNGKYFAHNGTLTSVKIKRNHCKDSKAIDGVVYFQNKDNGNYLELFFFCKYTKEVGGDQDYIPFEVEVTRNCISKNTNENLVVFFMMEGNYWKPSIIDECDFDGTKTIYTNRNIIEKTLIDTLKFHNLI